MTPRLRRIDFLLIYLLQMLAAVSISILFSILPTVGRVSGIPDAAIVATQALSAATWFFVAAFWSRVAMHRGRKFVIMVSAIGMLLVCITTGLGIMVAVSHVISPALALIVLVIARGANGAIGIASGPAGQAYVIERSNREQRTVVLSSLASSYAIGTVIGPAIAPFLTHLPWVGLAGPMFVMAAIIAFLLPLVAFILPSDAREAGQAAPVAAADPAIRLWHVRGMRHYLVYSTLFAVATAGMVQAIGFLVIDTVALSPEAALPLVGQAIAAGAIAMLLFQLVFVPVFRPSPRFLMLFAPVCSIIGLALIATLPSYPLLIAAIVITNLGFAAARPGVQSAASLTLPMERQTELSAAMLSTASVGIIVGPVTSVWLYSIYRPLPYLVLAALLAAAFAVCIAHPKDA